jgi:hypothetical protein
VIDITLCFRPLADSRHLSEQNRPKTEAFRAFLFLLILGWRQLARLRAFSPHHGGSFPGGTLFPRIDRRAVQIFLVWHQFDHPMLAIAL